MLDYVKRNGHAYSSEKQPERFILYRDKFNKFLLFVTYDINKTIKSHLANDFCVILCSCYINQLTDYIEQSHS